MPELTAGDIGWLGAGWLFAWMLGALVRLAARRARDNGRGAKPRCGRRSRTPPMRTAHRGGRLALAPGLLAAVPLALMLFGATGATHAVILTAAGALCGAWLARRWDQPAPPRFVAAAGCALGAAVVAGGFALHLLMPCHGVLERGALYVAVSLGAWALAASASVCVVDFRRGDGDRGHRARRRPARFAATRSAFDDRITYGLALTLCAALAYGFVAAGTTAQFRLAALIAACGLACALGVRMMTGARLAAANRVPAAGWRAVVARAGAGSLTHANLVGIPDELLVAACGGETFDAACLLPFGIDDNGRDGSRYDAWLPAMPRRRRGRYGNAGRPRR